ncbi:MAG: hypothetical protein Q9219_005625 [cf. Caloplaca sp. 3 TL-2023]
MPVLTRIKTAIAVIKAPNHHHDDSKDNNRQARHLPLIRHQNPRLNGPGIAPAPPLPQSLQAPTLNVVIMNVESKASDRSIQPLPVDRSRFGFRPSLAKKKPSDDDKKKKKIADGNTRMEEQKPQGNHAKKTKEAPPPPPKPTIVRNTTPPIPNNNNNNPLATDKPLVASPTVSPLLPRLPHRRMHFLRPLGTGGEGHCSLFRLHSPTPSGPTLLVMKTFHATPLLTRHRSSSLPKPLEAYILHDLLPPHPNILKLYDYTCSPRATRLYYEFCAGGDLQDIVDSYFSDPCGLRTGGKKIPEGFIWHVFAQLASAIHHLHTASSSGPILHRDIKPANIFLRPSSSTITSYPPTLQTMPTKQPYPSLLLSDFGCATHHLPSSSSSSSPTSCVGTLEYQGPELPLQNTAGDIWALGSTIHALVHGGPAMRAKPRSHERASANERVERANAWGEERVERAEREKQLLRKKQWDWAWSPTSRVVSDVRARGYSEALQRCVLGCLRGKWEERWSAGEVVAEVGRAVGGSGGK